MTMTNWLTGETSDDDHSADALDYSDLREVEPTHPESDPWSHR